MIRFFLHKRSYNILIPLACCVVMFTIFSFINAPGKNGKLKITFVNTANGKIISLRDSVYTNSFGEKYSVSKLKYYIGNFLVPGSEQLQENDPYHLMNAADSNNSFEVLLKPGNYKTVKFLLGVDSASNCSGAQTGALDPANDMFWTWNSGYVMFKLEGTSSSSTADLQRIEHHIGGYKGSNNVTAKISLDCTGSQLLQIKENSSTELIIETNLDHYWKNYAETKISEMPVCTLPGTLAKKIASNFTGLFSIRTLK